MLNNTVTELNPLTGLPLGTKGDLKVSGSAYGNQPLIANPSESQQITTEAPQNFTNYGVSLTRGNDIQEARAQGQGAGEQLLHGGAKMVGLAGTTFLDGTLGTVAGLANVLTGGEDDKSSFSDFVNNPLSNALLDFNDVMEQKFPNYYTQEGQGAFTGIVPLTKGSANFWGDKFIKNTGFALGAMMSGMAEAKVMEGILGSRAIANRISKSILDATNNESKTAEILKAIQEGDRTAVNNLTKGTNILESIAQDSKALQNKNLIQQWTGAAGGAIGESRLEALGNARDFREKELANLQQKYGDNIPSAELADLDNRTENYQNAEFGINMAILTLTDFGQFSDAFKSPYAKSKALLGDISGDIESGYNVVKSGKFEKGLKLLSNPVYEGTQEQLQYAAQKGSDDYFSKRYDANGKEITNNVIDSYIKGLAEAYGTAEGWEQGVIGAMTGALGMPNVSKILSKEARNNSKVNWWEGGIHGDYKEIQETEKNTQEAVKGLNEASKFFKDNGYLKEHYENLVRTAQLNKEANAALAAGDKFEYKNKEEDKLLSNVLAFYNAGKIEDIEGIYKGIHSKSASEIRDLFKVTTNEKGEKLAEAVDPLKGMTDEEVKTYYNNKANETLDKINTIKRLKSDIDGKFANSPEAYKEELLHYAYTIHDVDKRFDALNNEIKLKTGGASIVTNGPDGKFISEPIVSPDEPVEFNKFIKNPDNYKAFKESVEKHVKKHPEQNDLIDKADDLIKLAQRKKDFVDKYLDGLTKNGKQRMLEKMLKDITDKLEPEVKKSAANKSFKEQVLAKGYSEKRLENKSGIFIKFGNKTYTLRSINGEQVLYDPIKEQVVQKFETADDFNNYLLKNPNYQVLSVEEYKDYSKAQKLAKYRQAEIEALKSLISRVTEKGKETKEKIAEKQKELNKKIKEVEDLVNSINKETLTSEFREELQGLVKDLQDNIDNLKSEIADLQATREDLLKYYEEYNNLKKQLEAEQDSYININKLIDEEQQNIANQAQLAINEVTKAIADALEKLDYYQDYHQVIQDLILNDMIFRDFLTSEDFTAAFNAKYPDKLKARLTPEFMTQYEELLKKKNYQLSPKQLDQIRQVKDLLKKNPEYYKDLNSLLAQKADLIELGKSLKFKEENLSFTEQEIKRLKEAIPALVVKRDELIAKQGAKEFDSTIKLKALDEFKKIARRRIDAFEKLVPQELADQTTKNGVQTKEPGSSLDKTKEQRERENMKKGTWSSTTGVVIQYKYNPTTGRYEDILGEDGLPLFTDSKSQLLWAKFLDDNSKELASGNYALEFHLHDPNGTSALDKQITANISADKVDAGNDIYAVIIDKNGKPVTVNGQHLFTGIHKVDTLFPEDGSLRLIRENAVIGERDPGLGNYLDGISPATAIKVKYQDKSKTIAEWQKEGIWDDVLAARKKEIFAQEKELFNNFREGIKARLNKGEKVTSEIKSVSDGIPYLDKTLKSAKSFIGDDFTLDYDLTGTFIATTKDGQKIPIEGGKLTDADVKTVIEILKYAFPKGEEHFNGTIKLPKGKDGKQLTYQGEDTIDIFPTGSGKPSVLGSLIYYGRNKEGSKKFNIWGKGTSIQFVDEAGNTHIITRESLYQPTSQGYLDLQSFLGTKNLNFNRAFIKPGLYFHPIVKDGKLDFKIYKNYNDFVKERAKTYLHKTSPEHPSFTNRYITYSTDTTQKPKEEPKKIVVKEKEEFDEDMDPDDLITQQIENAKKEGKLVTNQKKEEVIEGPMTDAGAFGLDAIIAKKEEKKEEIKDEFTDLIKELSKIDYPERVAILLKKGIIDDKAMYWWMGRQVIVVNINGKKIPFYRSAHGTGGKTKDKWYPFFGFGKGKESDDEFTWIVKGSIEQMEKDYDSPLITKYSKLLNETLNWDRSLDKPGMVSYGNSSVNGHFAFGQLKLVSEEEINTMLYNSKDSGIVNDGKGSVQKVSKILDGIKEKTTSKLNVTRKPKGKERVATLTNEDALKRLRELVQSGEIEKRCS